ncbi:iron-dicitrate ABC transporter ATP-binding protein [Planotetraspora thailandica]|uniref:Iron-dicitrate ABC transporter ATP-binding protein n=1 Tax=Planotetraspora thailandica TaxID=487172 RepID=A0A8J3VA28_9ACTN|nr:ABC transporter ATP-binding protein [Planotetraspora thailandica]GII57766.1 iron-dicitrate ABC transporter ATP-binding protein [Planotetraspora thailandica]
MPDHHGAHGLGARGLSTGYGSAVVLGDVTLDVPEGRITALIGANGCGKSTLLRTLGRALDPLGGTVLLDGEDIATRPRRAVARLLALLPQSPLAPEGLTVRELCGFGRHPHRGMFSRDTADDQAAVAHALTAAGLDDLADVPLHRLSGGQRQRAWIAMALAQETPIMLLDEPTTYLDIAHQLDVLNLLAELNQTQGRTVVMVLHDLNQAAQYAHHLIAVAGGRVHATGSPDELLTPELIRAVFGVEAVVVPHPVTGTPLCLPIATGRAAEEGADPAEVGG